MWILSVADEFEPPSRSLHFLEEKKIDIGLDLATQKGRLKVGFWLEV